jgi:hypothetical protein
LNKIITWLVIAALAYFAYSYGRPYLENLTRSQSSASADAGDGGDGICVRSAQDATENFASKATRFSPPVDQAEWQSALSMSRGRLQQARDACRCSGSACESASRALDQLDDFMNQMDGAMAGGGSTFNPARGLDAIYNALERAEKQVGT